LTRQNGTRRSVKMRKDQLKAAAHTLALALAFAGCSRSGPTPTPPNTAAPVATSAAQTLDQMDGRKPVPLLPMMANHQKQNMRDHLAAVQEIIAALATDDFKAVGKAAGRIGFSEQMGAMCTHMGAGAPGFTEQAINFHRTADGISDAARASDRKRVLAELGATLKTCTACHAAWKQQIVDEATWHSLTSSAPPTHGHDQ
jgi:predicted small lipoprotein YifL